VDARELCPLGWHVPSDADWFILTDNLGGEATEGGEMKSLSDLWHAPNEEASNSSGFSSLPAGLRNVGGNYSNLGVSDFLWSNTDFDFYEAWFRYLYNFSGYVGVQAFYKHSGNSVRCLRD
jgi:uncharacterized protein (TIGR02145 family)